MLVIRLQRTGRSGHAQFRVVVQDSRVSPKSGKVVEQLGHYNPHSKEVKIDSDRADHFLKNGAQPSERVVTLLKASGIKLPKWVPKTAKKKTSIKHPEKLRRNRPATPVEPKKVEEDHVIAEPEVAVTESTSEPETGIEATQPDSTEEAKVVDNSEAVDIPEEAPADK